MTQFQTYNALYSARYITTSGIKLDINLLYQQYGEWQTQLFKELSVMLAPGSWISTTIIPHGVTGQTNLSIFVKGNTTWTVCNSCCCVIWFSLPHASSITVSEMLWYDYFWLVMFNFMPHSHIFKSWVVIIFYILYFYLITLQTQLKL